MLNILEQIKFGLEHEVCVNIGVDEYYHDSTQKKMVKCFNHKPLGYKWVHSYVEDDPKLNYNVWNITGDMSIGCPSPDEKDDETKGKYCILTGKKTNCPNITFSSVEIITPILQGYNGLKTFEIVWFGYIMSNRMTYLTNNTQGLHVHISHPKLDLNKFLKLWYIYEPVIMNIIDPERRENLDEFTGRIQTLCSYKYLKHKKTLDAPKDLKYYAVNIKHYRPDSCRIEIRIYHGTVIFHEILNWLKFLMIFTAKSIISSSSSIDTLSRKIKYNSTHNRKLAVKSLLKLISDKNVCKYLLKLYHKNKHKIYPNVDYTCKDTVILPSSHLSKNEWKMVKLNSKSCV